MSNNDVKLSAIGQELMHIESINNTGTATLPITTPKLACNKTFTETVFSLCVL